MPSTRVHDSSSGGDAANSDGLDFRLRGFFTTTCASQGGCRLWGRFVPILIQQRLHISLSACWVVYISLINYFTDESMICCSLFTLFPLKGWLTRARWRGGGSLKDGDDPEHLSELSLPVICEYHFNHFVSMFITFALIKIKCAPLIFLCSSNFSLSLGSEQICLFSLVVAV
jgi:hypothetical protein